jgi:hypothetical protein
MNNQSAIKQFIKDGGQAVITARNGQAGVLFTDESLGQFIPWGDLGYNADLGFYEISKFPTAHNDVGVNFSAARFRTYDGEEEYSQWAILADDGTDGFVIGEWGSVVQLHAALSALLETGQAEEIDELDERLGHPWMTISEAARYAQERCGVRISIRGVQYACERGEIRLANRDNGKWRLPQRPFVTWLANRPKPGPKKGKKGE